MEMFWESSKTVCDEHKSVEESSIPKSEIVPKRGTRGDSVSALSNCIRLETDPKKGVFEYEVCFQPNINNHKVRTAMLNEHSDKFGGTKSFDGSTLYLPILLPDKITKYNSVSRANNSTIEIKVIYKQQKALRDCAHFYNMLFNRIMRTLKYVQYNRKQFDPTAIQFIPQHRLEVWPGYVTAVDEYEGGIMLCCDVAHKILSQTSVLDSIKSQGGIGNSNNFQVNVRKALIGSVVLTRYNNRTYRIDDVKFDSSPMSTFKIGDRETTFIDYYKNKHNIIISDTRQPMLLSNQPKRSSDDPTSPEVSFLLVPELCTLNGLRNEQLTDFKLMRDITTCTRTTPAQRVEALKKFYQNVNNTKEAREILEVWGLKMGSEPDHFIGRQFEPETISLRTEQFSAGDTANFGKHLTQSKMIETVEIKNWLLIYCNNNARVAQNFIELVETNSAPLGLTLCKPSIQVLANDRTDTFVRTLRKFVTEETQIVFLICPRSRDDLYVAIKKLCCTEVPVISQIIYARTLSKETTSTYIVQKILQQTNCKLGGVAWSIEIPFRNVMICGIDIYYDTSRNGASATAFVASFNSSYTRWYSKACVQANNGEIVNGLVNGLKAALAAYKKYNQRLPEKIIIFRDGVSDGQLKFCTDFEVPQLKEACSFDNPDYEPNITFIVVQKQINKRIFSDMGEGEFGNPNPGFVLDHTITGKYLYDYFIVSQAIRQGTVTPTRYIVVCDESGFSSDILQTLSYKLCYMYYNCAATVRVPACCQYATRLALLIGKTVKQPPAEKLCDKLFYL